MGKQIEHSGKVIDIKDDKYIVKLSELIRCEACQIKGACQIAGQGKMVIEVPKEGNTYKMNDELTIVFREALGFKAVFIGYLFPMLLLISFIIISGVFFTLGELFIGLGSLVIVIIYYMILYSLRKKLNKAFTLKVK